MVIDSPYAAKKIDSGVNYFKAYPFFFNNFDYSKFSFEWSVDGRVTEDSGNLSRNELKLTIDSQTPSGFGINISLLAKNLLDEMEFASKNIKLQVK